ncbi:MAG: electron transfer flavoprotein subunit alpha/FixB family protein [Chloroflexi bacterium]|nr:electron transfer flavoprotein subunit alpha/FixB family protein [Chloroflexota bacterium]
MILVIAEQDAGRPTALSLEARAVARATATAAGLPLEAVELDRDGAPPGDRAAALGRLIAVRRPLAVIGPGSDSATELLAHVAARAGLPLAANITALDVGGSGAGRPLQLTRQRWGGTLLEDATIEAGPALFTVAPHAVAAEPVGTAPEPLPVSLDVDGVAGDGLVRLVERVPMGTEGVALEAAPVVVGGGRGVGSAEAFGMLDELARLLGGTVGVSRAVTSAGWRPHREQVGQTGARIAPDLYIACGISGAVQHIVGCRGAKRILAINTDPDAPMVAAADWAVIGDLHALLPPLLEAIRDTR